MAIWTEFNTEPGANNKNPPIGAPEGRFSFDFISDTFRTVMAAIREVGDIAITTAGAVGSLGTQNRDNVSITGGNIGPINIAQANINVSALTNSTIGTTNSVAGEALKVGTIPLARFPLQDLYNLQYPVGTQRVYCLANSLDLYWTGVSAQWTFFAAALDSALVVGGNTVAIGGNAGSQNLISVVMTDSPIFAGVGFTGLGASEHKHAMQLDLKRHGIGLAIRVA